MSFCRTENDYGWNDALKWTCDWNVEKSVLPLMTFFNQSQIGCDRLEDLSVYRIILANLLNIFSVLLLLYFMTNSVRIPFSSIRQIKRKPFCVQFGSNIFTMFSTRVELDIRTEPNTPGRFETLQKARTSFTGGVFVLFGDRSYSLCGWCQWPYSARYCGFGKQSPWSWETIRSWSTRSTGTVWRGASKTGALRPQSPSCRNTFTVNNFRPSTVSVDVAFDSLDDYSEWIVLKTWPVKRRIFN